MVLDLNVLRTLTHMITTTTYGDESRHSANLANMVSILWGSLLWLRLAKNPCETSRVPAKQCRKDTRGRRSYLDGSLLLLMVGAERLMGVTCRHVILTEPANSVNTTSNSFTQALSPQRRFLTHAESGLRTRSSSRTSLILSILSEEERVLFRRAREIDFLTTGAWATFLGPGGSWFLNSWTKTIALLHE